MSILRYIVMILVLSFSATVAGQNPQQLIDECEDCHGPRGVSSEEDVPSLAGRDAAELFEALEAFYYYERHCSTTTYRQGERPKTPLNMCNISNTLSAEDKRTIANHFSAQPNP